MPQQLTASDLRIGDIGRTIVSFVYRDKNKTSKPISAWSREHDAYVRKERETFIESIYAHSNGNILLNNGTYLRPDTPIRFLEEEHDD